MAGGRQDERLLKSRRRPSAAAAGARRAQIEALRALTPEERVKLAVQSKELADLLREAGRRARATGGGPSKA